ncbi:hypothetical protein [Haloglomus salinum]|uniref:hypothetical protein n=1 Tax=Haloglomus salinum TaxID=2962673 RepID=UPI0020C9FE75|nr:hypothetical protein [Haloglomus salinum]
MSKEDRYSHLGDDIETETTDSEAADETTDGVRVTIQDGDEETVLTVDPDIASADDVREAVENASSSRRASVTTSDPGRLALELGTLGPRLALKGVESLFQMDRTDRGER